MALELLQQCEKFFGIIVLLCGSMVGLTCHASQVCCSQSPCPHSRPLLIHAPTGDKHSKAGLAQSLVGSLGPDVHNVLFEPSELLWWVWGLIQNIILPLLLSCWGLSFALGHAVSFFGGIQHSPVNGCSAISCNFGVLIGEDEYTSFHSAIFLVTFW